MDSLLAEGIVDDIEALGGWESDASDCYYLNAGKALLLSTTLSARTQERSEALSAM